MALMTIQRRRRTLALAASLAAAAFSSVVLAPAPATAHAELVSSSPASGASLLESPPELELTFTEPIDPATAVVRLLDAEQQPVLGAGATTVDGSGLVATTALPEVDPGTYTVTYQVVSAVDGHATAGLLAFVVDPTGSETAPVQPASSTSPSVDAASIGARWIALTGILVALGSLVMWWHAGIGVLRGGSPEVDRRPPWLLVGVSSALAMGGLAAYLTLAARPIVAALGGGHGGHGGAGFPGDFAAPFGWTPFAIAMRVALAAAAAVFGVAVARYFSLQDRVAPPGEDRRLAALAAAALAVGLAGMSMAGHAAARGGPASGAIDWAHLMSVAVWLGALPAAFVLARRAGTARRTMLGAILRRHSRLALVAGPVTALTGLASTPLVLGAPRELVATDYGNLLIAKAVLLSVALGLGAVNHLALRRAAKPRLPVLIGADLGVALLAVLVAATMVTIRPAAGRQDVLVAPPTGPAHLYGVAGPSNVHAAVSAAAPGRQTYRVTVTDADGRPRGDVQNVFLTFAPPSADLPPERVELDTDATPGSYSTIGAHTPVEGSWTLEVTVRRAGATDESVSFDLPVAAPASPEPVPPPDTGVHAPAPLGMLWDALPAGPAGWLPALVAVVGVALSAWWARVARASRSLAAARVALLAVLAVTALGAGSRALVTAANQPPSQEPSQNPVAADAGSVARGERLYLANCASCHGVDGMGDGPVGTLPDAGPLADAVRTYKDPELSYRIAAGIAGTPMPAFAGTLSATDRWDLVNYLRHLPGAAGPQ